MSAVIDHVFLCTAIGAPGAGLLRDLGLIEGSPNKHPGQGTACRRFFFQNAMLELIWIEDEREARSEQTRRTRLWERWSQAGGAASPFGIILRPSPGAPNVCPFPHWDYRSPLMPDLQLQVAAEGGLEEPMWFYMTGGRPPSEFPPERRQPLAHPAGLYELSGVCIVCPPLRETSVTAMMARSGVIGVDTGLEHFMELTFDGHCRPKHADLRPELPLVLRW